MDDTNAGVETPAETATAIEEQQITLPLARFRERLERARRQVRREYGDLDPSAVAQLRADAEAYAADRTAWENVHRELSGKTEQLSADLAEARELHARERLNGELVRQFIAQGGLPAAIDDALNAMAPGAGEGEDFDPAEYVKEFLSGRPYFRRLPGAAGSGAPAGHAGPALRDGARLDSREGRLAAARRHLRD
jgi:hypothetical protein